MSPAGLEADMRHILVLVLLVGRLDDPDPTLRVTAAELLIGEQIFSDLLLYWKPGPVGQIPFKI